MQVHLTVQIPTKRELVLGTTLLFMRLPRLKQRFAERLYDATKGGGVFARIDERAKRCKELYDWSLKPHGPSKDSPLSLDDSAFDDAYPNLIGGSKAVTEHALYPIVSAVENLYTAGVLIERRRTHQQTHLSEVLGLCRVAMECAASAIWILGDKDREVRIQRCLRVDIEQLRQQQKFLKLSAKAEILQPERYNAEILHMNSEHRRKLSAMVDIATDAYRCNRPPQFTQLVQNSAEWIDTHVPAHDTGEIAGTSLSALSSLFYSYGSSFIHGYKWSTNYIDDGAIWSLLADTLAVSINMTECAACLFEAAALAPDGDPSEIALFPPRFTPTIHAWSTDLFDN